MSATPLTYETHDWNGYSSFNVHRFRTRSYAMRMVAHYARKHAVNGASGEYLANDGRINTPDAFNGFNIRFDDGQRLIIEGERGYEFHGRRVEAFVIICDPYGEVVEDGYWDATTYETYSVFHVGFPGLPPVSPTGGGIVGADADPVPSSRAKRQEPATAPASYAVAFEGLEAVTVSVYSPRQRGEKAATSKWREVDLRGLDRAERIALVKDYASDNSDVWLKTATGGGRAKLYVAARPPRTFQDAQRAFNKK